MSADTNLVSPPIRMSGRRGDQIPQHPLLTRWQWNYFLAGGIVKFSYWTTTGKYNADTVRKEKITIFRADYLEEPCL